MKSLKEFFSQFEWFNWGCIIPSGIIFRQVVRLFGVDPKATWVGVGVAILIAFQVFCLGFLVYAIIRAHRQHRRRMRELDDQIANPGYTAEQRDEILRQLTMLESILAENERGKNDNQIEA